MGATSSLSVKIYFCRDQHDRCDQCIRLDIDVTCDAKWLCHVDFDNPAFLAPMCVLTHKLCKHMHVVITFGNDAMASQHFKR